jgi:hypothetical protein
MTIFTANARIQKEQRTPAGVLGNQQFSLRGNATGQVGTITKSRSDDGTRVAGRANVGSTGGESSGPHFVVGQAMSADDAHAGEFTAETLNFREARHFHIDHGYFRTMLDNRLTKFRHGIDTEDSVKVMAERSGQCAACPCVGLQKDYAQRLHTTPGETVINGK